jgi:3-deoxy-D-manno-octulosonate 8-phosphate phosphatase (KDO 8-P phosphatase)
MSRSAADLAARCQGVRLLVCDVDGVLTDGTIVLDESGREAKNFSVLDGTALALAHLAGLQVAFLSGRKSGVVTARARECSVRLVCQGVAFKAPAFRDLCRRARVGERETAYIGDDLIDLPVFRLTGLAVAVANAVPEVKRAAHYVTRQSGGRGAVREAVETILRAQGHWDRVLDRYLTDHAAKN